MNNGPQQGPNRGRQQSQDVAPTTREPQISDLAPAPDLLRPGIDFMMQELSPPAPKTEEIMVRFAGTVGSVEISIRPRGKV